MPTTSHGWRGLKMRHLDGRTGVIIQERGDVSLKIIIQVDGDAVPTVTETIVLNADCRDSGATGWECCYPQEDGKELWGLLGDHNPEPSANSR